MGVDIRVKEPGMRVFRCTVWFGNGRFIPKDKSLDVVCLKFADDFGLDGGSGDFAGFKIEVTSSWKTVEKEIKAGMVDGEGIMTSIADKNGTGRAFPDEILQSEDGHWCWVLPPRHENMSRDGATDRPRRPAE